MVDDDGQIVVRRVMGMHATFDHRIIDGFHAALTSKMMRECFANPDEMFGAIPGAKVEPEPAAEPERASESDAEPKADSDAKSATDD